MARRSTAAKSDTVSPTKSGQASWMTPSASSPAHDSESSMWQHFMNSPGSDSRSTQTANATSVGMALNMQNALSSCLESAHRAASRAETAASSILSNNGQPDNVSAKKRGPGRPRKHGARDDDAQPDADQAALKRPAAFGVQTEMQPEGPPIKRPSAKDATLPAEPTLPEATTPRRPRLTHGNAQQSSKAKAMGKAKPQAMAKRPAAATRAGAPSAELQSGAAVARAVVHLPMEALQAGAIQPPRRADIKSFAGSLPPKTVKLVSAWEVTVAVWAWHFGAQPSKDNSDNFMLPPLQFPFGGRTEGQRMMWSHVKADLDSMIQNVDMDDIDRIRQSALDSATMWCQEMSPRMEAHGIKLHNM